MTPETGTQDISNLLIAILFTTTISSKIGIFIVGAGLSSLSLDMFLAGKVGKSVDSIFVYLSDR